MTNFANAPVWKRIYEIITGKTSNVSVSVVEEILKLYKQQLFSNLLEYKPYSKESFRRWKEESGLKELVLDDEMCNFIHLLSKEINLAVDISWTIICNFLMFEYYGKVDELKTIIRYDTNVCYFVENIWHFYSADRMFLLKTLKFILEESSNDKKHIFHEQFKTYLNSINVNLLWKNLLKVFSYLIEEVDKDKTQKLSESNLHQLINRNHREQVEVVLILLNTAQHYKLNGNELEEVLTQFIKHGFARHPFYSAATVIARPNDIVDIMYAEIGCVLSIIDKYWNVPGICKSLPKTIVKHLELLPTDANIILFAWSVFRTSIEDSDEALDYCNMVITELIKKDIFGSLYRLISHKMFKNCVAGNIVVDAVFELTKRFIKLCIDYDLLHDQINLYYLISELLKRKGMIVLESIEPIFQLAIDIFPFVFNPFIEICKSLIQQPGNYNTVMKLLKNIPGFLTEIPWKDHRNSFQIVSQQRVFTDSDLFIIPQGTLVEKYLYQGTELMRFVYPFSFFTLMEQFTNSLTINRFQVEAKWYCYENVLHMMKVGYKFIIEILKRYEGDFISDMIMKRLIQHMQILSTQLSENSEKQYELFTVYFELMYTIIKYKILDFSEAFLPLIRKKIFPQALNYNKVNKHIFFNQIHNGSILMRNIKIEESKSDHSLLLLYLRLIHDMIEENQYYEEIQLTGVWYILNIVFPFYQQWSYSNPQQIIQICKLCCSIFVIVLQKQLTNSDSMNDVFKMCLNSFMHEEMIISSYLSVFLKDKYYLQNLMQQETNWFSGLLLENLECIRLQLVLLLLLLKHRALKAENKCTIDDKISIISKAVSAYMVNPYNGALRILSCRCLEVLSRDENIPLMALLGLDYDQVQCLFLDRLRDPTEDDDLKLHILDLISTCIFSQHGMTAAFFNVKRSRKWYSDNREKTVEADTVSDFMIDYLQNIKKSHEYLRSPLQVGILNCMANLWMCGKQHLIKDVIDLKEFWPLLAEPLFQTYNQTPKVYAQILKIFSIQLGEAQNDKKFLSIIEKFVTNDKQLELWQQYLLNIFKTENTNEECVEDRRFVIKSWMEFLIMLEKRSDLRKIPIKRKDNFVEMSFMGVSYKMINMYCLSTWIDLCLIQISCWGFNHQKNISLIEKAINMFEIIKLHYNNLNSVSRSGILAIVQIILRQSKEILENDSMNLIKFVEEVGHLINYEYDVMEEEIWQRIENVDDSIKESTLPWVMCLNIINILLEYKNVKELTILFSFSNYLAKIVKTVCQLLNHDQTLPLVKLAIQSMLLYIDSPLYFDFLNVNLTKFYSVIEPSLTVLLFGQSNKVNPSHLEEGWITATVLMKFNQRFLQKFQHYALKSCYSFITIHEQILQHIFSIPESTVALRALDLLINTLAFFDTMLVNWQLEWYKKSNVTYNFIINGMKKVINACLYTVLRPKNIIVYTLDNYNRLTQLENIPIELTVEIMNKLITTAALGFSILYKINPSLIDLQDVCVPDTVTVLVSNDFTVPKFELPIPYDLNYSMLLCLVHFLCKTLDALNIDDKNPTTIETPKKYYSKCFGLVEHQDLNISPNQKLSSFLRYAMYEYSGLAERWIKELDYHCVKRCLESLITFLAQQICLTIVAADFDTSPYFKRNLESELQFFHEYVKKCTSVLLSKQVSTPRTDKAYKAEMDLQKRYMLHCKETKNTEELIDKNFCLVISHYLTNVCKLK